MKDNAIVHKKTSNLVGISSFKIKFWGKNTYFWPFLVTFDQKNLTLHSILSNIIEFRHEKYLMS